MTNKQNSVSLYQQISWKKQNKFLQQDAQDNIQLKKQINKESDMDSLVQTNINDKIYNLKVQATQLSKKLQNEKYKNMQLQTIIKTMKIRMEDDKRSQATFINDSNSQNNQTLQRKMKKYQYDLSQLNTKTNKVSSLVTDGKNQISLLRTQRCIDSSIFRNIQKELIQSQMQFKKLLIEKIRHQKIYNQNLNQYNSLKSKAAQFFNNQQTSRKTSTLYEPNIEQNSELMNLVKHTVRSSNAHSNHSNHPQSEKNNKFKQIVRPSQFCRQIFNNSSVDNHNDDKDNSHYQFAVKKLLLNLNMANQQEFVYMYNNIDNINEQYFKELNQKSDQINKLEEEVMKIQHQIKQNGIKFYKSPKKLTKSQQRSKNCEKLNNQIINVKEQTQQKVQMYKNFMKTNLFQEFIKHLSIPQNEIPTDEQFDLESFSNLFQKIQGKMNNLRYYSLSNAVDNEPSIPKTGRSERQRKQQKLEDVMNRIKVHQESDKIMRQEDFREEYRKILEANTFVNSRQNLMKKKTKKILF